jgi:lipopolysaccharide/colanic/teichoic acid biosynthesis glycosyltransferase
MLPRLRRNGSNSLHSVETKNGFYISIGKRLTDIGVATVILLLLGPLFALVGLLLKLTSPGPVFYLQDRVGKAGTYFKLVKFRTMRADAETQGPSITASGDPRIFPFGRILRSMKIDELPQLWNILKGDMSLVGPRPEVPIYVETYTAAQREVLSVRPGITDPASILYRHEEELLGTQADPEGYYRQILLPHKLSLNLEYIRHISFGHDLSLLGKTFVALLFSHPKYTASVLDQ